MCGRVIQSSRPLRLARSRHWRRDKWRPSVQRLGNLYGEVADAAGPTNDEDLAARLQASRIT